MAAHQPNDIVARETLVQRATVGTVGERTYKVLLLKDLRNLLDYTHGMPDEANVYINVSDEKTFNYVNLVMAAGIRVESAVRTSGGK